MASQIIKTLDGGAYVAREDKSGQYGIWRGRVIGGRTESGCLMGVFRSAEDAERAYNADHEAFAGGIPLNRQYRYWLENHGGLICD